MRLTSISRFAVPFFSASVAFFAVRHSATPNPIKNFPKYLFSRIERIYFPFLIWSVVYLIARIIKHVFSSSASPIVYDYSLLLNGPTHHLWFLPYALFISVIFSLIGALLHPLSRTFRLWASLLLVASALGTSQVVSEVPIDLLNHPSTYFLHYSVDAFPSALFGCAIGLNYPFPSQKRFIILVSIPVMLLSALMLYFGNIPLVSSVVGSLLLIAALAVHSTPPQWLRRISALSFGIYTSHVLFIEGFQFLLTNTLPSRSLSSDIFIFLLASAASLLLCIFLSRYRITRFLVQ